MHPLQFYWKRFAKVEEYFLKLKSIFCLVFRFYLLLYCCLRHRVSKYSSRRLIESQICCITWDMSYRQVSQPFLIREFKKKFVGSEKRVEIWETHCCSAERDSSSASRWSSEGLWCRRSLKRRKWKTNVNFITTRLSKGRFCAFLSVITLYCITYLIEKKMTLNSIQNYII